MIIIKSLLLLVVGLFSLIGACTSAILLIIWLERDNIPEIDDDDYDPEQVEKLKKYSFILDKR